VNDVARMQVAHALGYLAREQNNLIEIGPLVDVTMQILVQRHTAAVAHYNGDMWYVHAGAYEQDQVGVTRLAQIQHLFLE